jgi:hypothetical protein
MTNPYTPPSEQEPEHRRDDGKPLWRLQTALHEFLLTPNGCWLCVVALVVLLLAVVVPVVLWMN